MFGALLTIWTVRLALACYAVVLARQLIAADRRRWQHIARVIWTAGCVLFVIHVACAFHFYHDWSHQHALDHTASETQRLLGFSFGEGIYFSYAFTLLWAADATWWWIAGTHRSSRTRPLGLFVHAYLFFIAFNGAIVFEDGPTRWAGIAACVLLGLLLLWNVLGKKGISSEQPSAVGAEVPARSDPTNADR